MAETKITLNLGTKTVEMPVGHFINNRFVGSISNSATSKLVNPTTEEPLCTLPMGAQDDVDAAVAAANAAFESSAWAGLPSAERGRLLYKLSDAIEAHREEIARIESLNVGKAVAESFHYDLKQVINTFRYFAGFADKYGGKQVNLQENVVAYVAQVPLGVVGMIMPWNFPLQLLCWKLAPALCVGNTVVIKPAEITPLSTLYLVRLMREVGFPPGVVNVVLGKGSTVGMALCRHTGIEKIGFTGSTDVGRLIQAAAAEKWIKPVSLELGGKSPIIVFDDVADFDKCVTECYHALFWNAGQCCSAGSRIFVQRGIYERFVAAMKKMVESRKLGDPLDMNTQQGPQVNKQQMESVLQFARDGIKEGARLVCGSDGTRATAKGFFVPPTVFADVTDNMRICREEIFGPIMSILVFDTAEEVLKRANHHEFGLVGAVYSEKVDRCLYISERLRTGIVWVNTFNFIDPAIPWGGFKQSGHGRDQGEACLAGFTTTRSTVISYSAKL